MKDMREFMGIIVTVVGAVVVLAVVLKFLGVW